jgi:hypothetical protein
MKAMIDRVSVRFPLTLEVINIDDIPALADRYGLEIPVLLVNGTKVAKYRVKEETLERTLRDRA